MNNYQMNNNQAHILLVEDDPAIAASLKITFKREGWQVSWLDNASAVLPLLKQYHQDDSNNNGINNGDKPQGLSAIILDVGLPDGDGLSLCQQIRHSDSIGNLNTLPIIFLTARSEEVDRILGLEVGGDDYCPKPFSPRELVARLKAIWRRQQLSQSQATEESVALLSASNTNETPDALTAQVFNLASGAWLYEPKNYRLFWQQQKLNLSNTERKLLLAFLQAPNRVFSREQLLTAISDYPDHRLARTIDSHIKSIRKQLADIDPSIEVIHTHRGIGYGLCPA
ncbi:response regulator [Psychrobacter sp. I-STPA10]|uniref:response regulator n=1 Tax=Psychrobacter sp. I-STPA10 TaxID=2585769 RepID=UPI002E76A722|nr:response regulator [Psychrobacter sp. I-STPA10]